MDPIRIIEKFYAQKSRLYKTLVEHSRIVADISLEIARNNSHLNPDVAFIEKAAMLHDIGIVLTRAELIGCFGDKPYICHGILGKSMLDELGLDKKFGRVCERHTGAGITRENVLINQLPLPERDMVPQTLEEKIICVADKYHSKSPKKGNRKLTTDRIVQKLERIDPGHAQRFSAWVKELGVQPS